MQWPFIALTFLGVNWLLWKWLQDSEGTSIAERLWWFGWGEWFFALAPDWLWTLLLFALANGLMLYGAFYQLPESWQSDILTLWDSSFAKR